MAKKNALGKGLAALLGEEVVASKDEQDKQKEKFLETTEITKSSDAQVFLDINEIVPNDDQPRKIFDERSITELAQTIKEIGVLQPVIVTKKDNKYMLIIGERRWRASKKAGLDKIPVIIKDYSPFEVMQVALIENVQREDLNPIEEAAAYSNLISQHNLTHEKLSETVGKSRVAITNKMRLLKLPDDIQNDLVIGTLTEGHGRALLYLDDDKKIEHLRNKVISDALTVRETEKLAKHWADLSLRDIKSKSTKKEASIPAKNPDVENMEEKLSTLLGTKVIIVDKNNKGKIVIDYYSVDDFQRILECIENA